MYWCVVNVISDTRIILSERKDDPGARMILPPCKWPQEAQFAHPPSWNRRWPWARVLRNNMAGSSHLAYRLKAQKADNLEYLRPRRKTTILKMCKMLGQCCFQNAWPKVESRREVVTFRVFLWAVCKQARMCWMILEKMSLKKKRKQTDTVTQKRWLFWKPYWLH